MLPTLPIQIPTVEESLKILAVQAPAAIHTLPNKPFLPDWDPYNDVTMLLCDGLSKQLDEWYPSLHQYTPLQIQSYYQPFPDPAAFVHYDLQQCITLKQIAEHSPAQAQSVSTHLKDIASIIILPNNESIWSYREKALPISSFTSKTLAAGHLDIVPSPEVHFDF